VGEAPGTNQRLAPTFRLDGESHKTVPALLVSVFQLLPVGRIVEREPTVSYRVFAVFLVSSAHRGGRMTRAFSPNPHQQLVLLNRA